MPWTYSQSTGNLLLNGVLEATGYAGRNLGEQHGRNNPELQNVVGIGPLPRGWYTIGPEFHHPHTGPVSMRLEPDPTNEMHDRNGFLIHGDNNEHDASEGCIILPRPVRERISQLEDKRLEVVA
jgi:hypothetical protein